MSERVGCDDLPLKIHGGDMIVTLFLQCIKNKPMMVMV